MTLLLLFAVLAAFATAVEVLNLVAPDFLAGLHREAALKESIAKTQVEIAESEKRLHSLRAGLRNAHLDVHRAADGLEKLDEKFAERRRVDPILVYPIASTNKTSGRYRAPLSKVLPPEPEESQTLIWAKTAFVEVEANGPEEAHRIALRQFPAQHGYVIGAFQDVTATAREAAA